MLEKLPHPIGRALRDVRPGLETLVYNDDALAGAPECIRVESPAFQDGAPIPERFTADGEKLSPPLQWSGVPKDAASVVLLVEDADAPAPAPLVHAIAWALPGEDASLPEGALASPGAPGEAISLGRNAFFSAQYLPPDPPPGHGLHRYVFQVYALDRTPELHGKPIRTQVVHAIRDRVIGKGRLIGVYERP